MEALGKFLIENNYEERKRVEKLLPFYHEYMKNILYWNEKINVTSIRQKNEFIQKHYIDSLSLLKYKEWFLPRSKVIDIGTGGGFPGIPLAIFFPEVHFVLVDSVGKKLEVIKECIKPVSLNNVTLIKERAEILGRSPDHRQQYHICVSRAVAPLQVLSELCLPLVKKKGCFISYKGKEGIREVEESRNVISSLGGEVEAMDFSSEEKGMEQHGFIVIRKVKQTPEKYPREMKEIKKEWK
jgi:16S rRNA (guanine527-N7)-methyltransferase